ncbi:hypothetical protein [Mycoplasma struthionis]|uniref:Gcp-like domain-containing protein n=1 Tax=Mycoplasma struthionis TaxID=538220 RepID=A0A3G8LGZ3_9MOLU|nr:hypothetical protein [Mycoplasma struthionis]AZG68604.1 hypothetical protein EGN60_01310 [Mycoplasma struthionis]TPI02261.1 hypothetical protein FJM01_01160 [Mycoplasma struthionis]
MKLFIETSLDDLIITKIENNIVSDFLHIEKLTKKSDEFFNKLNTVIKKEDRKNLKAVYVTIGPGSFTGARVGFLVARTLAQISKIKLYVAPSYELLKTQKKLLNQDWKKIVIKANKHNNYLIDLSFKKPKVSITNEIKEYDNLDFSLFKNNISLYLKSFKRVWNLNKASLLYFHEPQIGKVENKGDN